MKNIGGGESMPVLKPCKLYVNYGSGITPTCPILGRCYTVAICHKTHQVYLAIGRRYGAADMGYLNEILYAKWIRVNNKYILKCYCNLYGHNKEAIVRSYESCICNIPLALEAIVYGDRLLFEAHPYLCNAPVYVHFNCPKGYAHLYQRETWKTVNEWKYSY